MSSDADKQLRRLYNNPAVTHAVNVLADHMITGAQYYALMEFLAQDATAEEDSLPEGMCPDCYCIGFHANGCVLTVGRQDDMSDGDLKMFGLHSCLTCGAVVNDGDRQFHDEWHYRTTYPEANQ